jgi:hypothetical protein
LTFLTPALPGHRAVEATHADRVEVADARAALSDPDYREGILLRAESGRDPSATRRKNS